MTNLQFNTTNIRRNPINRNNLFYSEESYNFEMEIGKNYLEQDVNQTVILYEVDLQKTNLDSLYGESKKDEIVFKTPVELHVIYTIEQPELKAYDKSKNLGSYVKTGKLTFGVYQSTLDELNCDIKIGDYVGIQISEEHMEIWTVVDDGRNNYDNSHTTFGYKSAYRTIKCAAVDENEFNGE